MSVLPPNPLNPQTLSRFEGPSDCAPIDHGHSYHHSDGHCDGHCDGHSECHSDDLFDDQFDDQFVGALCESPQAMHCGNASPSKRPSFCHSGHRAAAQRGDAVHGPSTNRGRSGSQSVPTPALCGHSDGHSYCHSVTRSDRQRRGVSDHAPLCHSVSSASSRALSPGFWTGHRVTP